MTSFDVDEPGEGHDVALVVLEQVGGDSAVGVGCEGDLGLAEDDGRELGDGRDDGDGVPVVLGGVPGLLLHAPDQIGEREPSGGDLLVGDPAGERDGLEVDSPDDVGVLEGELDDVPDYVVVHAHSHDGDEHDGRGLEAVLLQLPAVLDDAHLDVHHLPSPGPEVDVVRESVELEVDGVQTRLLGRLEELVVLGELDSVGGDLHLGEPELLGIPDDVDEPGVHRGLASGELDGGALDGLLGPEGDEHVVDLLVRGLVHVPRVVRVGEADRAVHVAPVRQVEVCDRGTGEHVDPLSVDDDVNRVIGIVADGAIHGVVDPDSVVCVLLSLEIQVDIGPVHIGEVSVLGACLLHVNLAVLGENVRLEDLPALGADGLGLLGKTLLHCIVSRCYRHVTEDVGCFDIIK